MRLKKLLAKAFIILATFFVVISPIVLVTEADHHCSHHEDCQICEVLRTAQQTIKQTNYTPTPTVVVVLAPIIPLLAIAIIATIKNKDFSTLVTLKTKISD